VYRSYFPMILKFIISNSGDEDDARDVFQESLIVLYHKIKSGNFQLNSKLKTFIYSVCRRLWLKQLSRKGRSTVYMKDFEETIPIEDDLEYHVQRDKEFIQMGEALLLLGEPCRTIIEDFYIHDKSMQEICEKFGYTNADNAKTQKYKCLQRLKKLFFQYKIDNDEK
jgi:RNA polymerase sigma factor (sigma-70 family)